MCGGRRAHLAWFLTPFLCLVHQKAGNWRPWLPLMHLNINPVLHLLRGEVLGGVALVLNIDTDHIGLISYKVK